MTDMPCPLDRLEARLGYTWMDRGLLIEALTHSSCGSPNNERLEYLGDSVLDLISAEWLMAQHPNRREGFLSQRRAELVRMCALASHARDLQLGEVLVVGRGSDYLRSVESVLADCLEAIVGALWLDSRDVTLVMERVHAWNILR